jgi:type I restriction enzyme S subunit
MEAIGERGELDASRERPIAEVASGFTCFQDGDVLVAKITPCFENGKGALVRGLLGGVGFGTTELHVLRPYPEMDARFLFYVTASHLFRTLGAASMYGAAGQQRISETFLRDYLVGVPSLTVQKAAATYLDRKTAAIDALIAKKERLIGLLEEKRQALITQAVTKGLDPGAASVRSGIASIGDVPKHWPIVRNKVIFREVDRRSRAGDEELLTVSHLTGVTPRAAKREVSMFLAESTEGYKLVAPNDLAVNTMWAWMGALGVSSTAGIVSPSYNVYRFRRPDEVEPLFFDLLLRTPPYVAEINKFSKGIWSSRLRLYPDAFLNMMTPVPPAAEQRAIVEHVRLEVGRDEPLAVSLRESGENLREYRQALITAAVTGQIDVGNLAGDRDDVVERVEAGGEA